MATQAKTRDERWDYANFGTYVYFGGKLHQAKDNADASRQFVSWIGENELGASNLKEKDGRIYFDGELVGHVSYNGRIWDLRGNEIGKGPNAQQHLDESKGIIGSLKLAVDELDDKAVIASFTKLIMARMMEGDDVTEQLHALNFLRQQAGLKLIAIPAGGTGGSAAAPKSEPRQEQRRNAPPRQEQSGGGTGMVIHVPNYAQMLPDGPNWVNRMKIPSSSSDRLYTVSQSRRGRFWGCDCPGWISRRKCKHLRALGLPEEEVPFEATLKQGSLKTAYVSHCPGHTNSKGEAAPWCIKDHTDDHIINSFKSKGLAESGLKNMESHKGSKKSAGKFKLYTGPTIVKQTADILRNAGINVTTEGTEHVHFIADGDRDGVTLQLREVLGPQWGVRNVQQLASKNAMDMIHSDNDLGLKLEPADAKNEPPVVSGPEAGPSNDEMYANGHAENGEGGSPMFDGNLKSPERANVNAIREALDTQQEMEVGKPIQQKQHEVEMAEKVQDAALAQGAGAIAGGDAIGGGTQAVEAKPGTQIIINVASKKKQADDFPGLHSMHDKAQPARDAIDQLEEQIMREGTENECPECEHPLPHKGPYGCEVERGDAPGGEGDRGPYGSYALPPCGCMYGVDEMVKRSAEPIGGEPKMQPGATSGHGGGMFGGTDLEGPSFHVGFTFKGYHREASFTSLAEADKFLTTASKKFGKLAGDWTMKCPHCGKTASKDKPMDNYKCGSCGWDSTQAKSARKVAEVGGPMLYQCFILDEMGDTEEATNAETPAQAMSFFTSRGIEPADLKIIDKPDKSVYTYMRTSSTKTATVDPAQKALVLEWLRSGRNMTTGEVEKQLGGGKYSNKAYPILMELAKEGLIKHKQMRWSLKTAKKKVADGWTNWETETVNLYITNDRKSYDEWWRMAEEAVDQGIRVGDLADEYKRVFADKERQFIREQNEEQQADNNFVNIAPTNWDEIAQDAMDYVRNERRAKDIDVERKHGPAEKRFQDQLTPEDREMAKGMNIKLESLRKATIRVKVGTGMPVRGTPEWHQVQVAIKSLKMPEAMLGVMGGPNKQQAAQILAQYGLKWDGQKVVKVAGDGMAKTETELEKEAGFNFFFPGQVLKEFYPEIQHEIVDYPNATNQSISQESPELVGDGGHEIDALVDGALDTSIVEMIQLPADVAGPFPMAASKKRAADYSSTSPAGGMGIGRDGKPEVLEGAPLRKENDIRGYMFTDEFYGQYDGIPGAAMNIASKTAAEGGEVRQFTDFLCMVCGEIAATMVAAFKVTHRPLLDKIPGVGEIQLDAIEAPTALSGGASLTITGSRVQFLLEQLNDSEIKQAINEAWAQSAVWHDGGQGGFVYEVFVRPETIDTDSLKMKYKFVCGTKE
jgi:hypothetical protein